MHKVSYRIRPAGFIEFILMLMRPRFFRGELDLPARWSEMTDCQIMRIVPQLYMGGDATRQKLTVLRNLTQLPERVWQKLTAEQIADMLAVLSWLWKAPPEFIQSGRFLFKDRLYHLPRQGLDNMCAIELANAEQHLRALCDPEKPDPSALNQLIATICRPEKARLDINDVEYDGDPREKYNADICGRRAVEFRCMSIGMRMMILQWYLAQVRKLQEDYSVVWPPPRPGRGAKTKSALAAFGLTKVLMDLADAGTFGDWEKVCYSNAKTLLTYLTQRLLSHQEAEFARNQNQGG